MSDSTVSEIDFPLTETAGDTVNRPVPMATGQYISSLTDRIGGGRSEARAIESEWSDLHRRSFDIEWKSKTVEMGKKSVGSLLDGLSELGFSWRDIARMVHVSVPAIRKWRRGGAASGDNRRNLAALLAACDMIMNHFMVDEIASWFEMPLTGEVPITPIDLYASRRADLVFEFASAQSNPDQLMDEFDPEWRERYRSDFDVVEAADGNFSIRKKR